MTLLSISDLVVTVEDRQVIKGLNLSVGRGEVHAIMGPNGAGKSTLANVIAGRQGYDSVSGAIRVDGIDVLDLTPEERAHLGVFLGFQYPIEIPGVSNMEFLHAALNSLRKSRCEDEITTVEFMKKVRGVANDLQLGSEFLKRGVNEGFSGGEKKRNEIVQMLVLEPRLVVLDETDSGLDVDALGVVAAGINRYRSADRSLVLITHYKRLLDLVTPDYVHVISDGTIARSGDASLASSIETRGFAWLEEA